jgi:hypothetical protein
VVREAIVFDEAVWHFRSLWSIFAEWPNAETPIAIARIIFMIIADCETVWGMNFKCLRVVSLK